MTAEDMFFGMLIGFFVTILVMLAFTLRGKTYQYRKVLTDMYIIGKLKQFAKEENIDLIGLLREFKHLRKILKEDMTIDRTIEQEINDKISDLHKENLS